MTTPNDWLFEDWRNRELSPSGRAYSDTAASIRHPDMTVESARAMAGIRDDIAIPCPRACNYRCSKTHHRKPCLFFCNKCCQKCLCVPSGTYGNKEECPCYNNWKTKEGRPKCP
ncbi:gibberellin-regulated protein 12-like [Juglans microcarpa x Juglans regia]|uniref:gibberellin-regulated protein 12-like n=1 Tax=Juglans microcarpa x Juglans regia TaxID=2249226 RepID=UPI001B7E40BD|nr:gibberellin-regulated protein 12-like [Juglans microcarpa x Juglans regia]